MNSTDQVYGDVMNALLRVCYVAIDTSCGDAIIEFTKTIEGIGNEKMDAPALAAWNHKIAHFCTAHMSQRISSIQQFDTDKIPQLRRGANDELYTVYGEVDKPLWHIKTVILAMELSAAFKELSGMALAEKVSDVVSLHGLPDMDVGVFNSGLNKQLADKGERFRMTFHSLDNVEIRPVM